MTVTTAPDVAPASGVGVDRPDAGQSGGPSRGPLAVLVVVLLAGLVVALAAGGPAGGQLDPRSPAPSGSRALAQLLGDQGVQVDLVTTSAAMSATHRDPATRSWSSTPTCLAASPGRGGRSDGRRPGAWSRPPHRTATCRASPLSRPSPASAAPGCDLPAAARGPARSTPAGIAYVTDDAGARSDPCRLLRPRRPTRPCVQATADGQPGHAAGLGRRR